MDSSPRVIYVSAEELRRLFNDGRYWERMLAGEFVEVPLPTNVARRRKGFRAGTLGRRTLYCRPHDRSVVAIVHEFLSPRGEPLRDRPPDPKRLRIDGITYTVDHLDETRS